METFSDRDGGEHIFHVKTDERVAVTEMPAPNALNEIKNIGDAGRRRITRLQKFENWDEAFLETEGDKTAGADDGSEFERRKDP